MKATKFPITIFIVCLFGSAEAKLALTSLYEQSVEDVLRNNFLGEAMKGIEISNATFNGSPTITSGDGAQIASFINDGSCDMLDMKQGLLLSTNNNYNLFIDNPEFKLGDLSVSAEDLYDFANYYLPAIYQKKIRETYYPYMYYEYYLSKYNCGNPPKRWLEEEKDEYEYYQKMRKTDDVFIEAFDYYTYTKEYFADRGRDISEEGCDLNQDEFEELYPIYAVFNIVRSWDPKYYTSSEEDIKRCKEMEVGFYTCFFYHYINDAPKMEYDRSKVELYEKIRRYACVSTTNNWKTDAELSSILGRETSHPAIIEFDFTTPNDSISFNFSFGSTYYVSEFNYLYEYEYLPDNLAILLTDETGQQKNLAVIPGTDQLISVKNINEIVNKKYFNGSVDCQNYLYYLDYGGSLYDGDNCECKTNLRCFTKTFTAKTSVEPCKTYHMKIAVAEVTRNWADCTLFLEYGSFKANALSTKIHYTNPLINGLAHDCSDGQIVVNINNTDSPTTINIKHIGEAKNGVNYQELPEQIVIPANTNSTVLDLIPNAIEKDSMEVVLVVERPNTCLGPLSDTIRTYIYNLKPITITPLKPECCASELSFEHTGEIKNIRWEPAELLYDNDSVVVHPIDCPIEEVVYTITAEDKYGCHVVEAELAHSPCPIELAFTVELTTDSSKNELIEGCSEGELLFRANRNKGHSEDIILEFDLDDVNIEGLNKTLTIPVDIDTISLPIKALKKESSYNVVSELKINCINCTDDKTDTILQVTTKQEEPLELGQDNIFKECEINGLEVEIPLLSGTVGDAMWEPMEKLESVNLLKANLADDIEGKSIDFIVTSKNESGCQTATTNVKVMRDLCVNLDVPEFFTPNNDGQNDFWRIKGLEALEKCIAKIYDRWGKLLFEFNPNEEGWDGTYNGNPCQTTDYWYEIDCEEIDKVYSGHFTLKR